MNMIPSEHLIKKDLLCPRCDYEMTYLYPDIPNVYHWTTCPFCKTTLVERTPPDGTDRAS